MMLFVILAPFAVFSVLMQFGFHIAAALSGAGVAAALVIYDIAHGRSVKILQTGAALLLSGIAAYLIWIDNNAHRSLIATAVDSGMLAIALGSLALRFPFTLQYAREKVEAEIQARPAFLRTNYILTFAWAGAFLLMLASDVATIYLSWLPMWTGLAVAVVARNGASMFTKVYPQMVRARVERDALVLQKALAT